MRQRTAASRAGCSKRRAGTFPTMGWDMVQSVASEGAVRAALKALFGKKPLEVGQLNKVVLGPSRSLDKDRRFRESKGGWQIPIGCLNVKPGFPICLFWRNSAGDKRGRLRKSPVMDSSKV